MRCSCPNCDFYMVHSESMRLGCVCPECGARCDQCLGTNTVISREAFLAMNPDKARPQTEATSKEPPRD